MPRIIWQISTSTSWTDLTLFWKLTSPGYKKSGWSSADVSDKSHFMRLYLMKQKRFDCYAVIIDTLIGHGVIIHHFVVLTLHQCEHRDRSLSYQKELHYGISGSYEWHVTHGVNPSVVPLQWECIQIILDNKIANVWQERYKQLCSLCDGVPNSACTFAGEKWTTFPRALIQHRTDSTNDTH